MVTGAVPECLAVLWRVLPRSATGKRAGLGAELSLSSGVGWLGRQTPASSPLLDLGGASRRTAGLSPSEARRTETSDRDGPAASDTIIQVQGEGALRSGARAAGNLRSGRPGREWRHTLASSGRAGALVTPMPRESRKFVVATTMCSCADRARVRGANKSQPQ